MSKLCVVLLLRSFRTWFQYSRTVARLLSSEATSVNVAAGDFCCETTRCCANRAQRLALLSGVASVISCPIRPRTSTRTDFEFDGWEAGGSSCSCSGRIVCSNFCSVDSLRMPLSKSSINRSRSRAPNCTASFRDAIMSSTFCSSASANTWDLDCLIPSDWLCNLPERVENSALPTFRRSIFWIYESKASTRSTRVCHWSPLTLFMLRSCS
mmetsp:Transcript_57037/g.101853  ORF Transcript_57037/g.101853 Transcript_57037/m.101853 type:complete len:211 (+) Transcript_57037:967-1599(+)